MDDAFEITLHHSKHLIFGSKQSTQSSSYRTMQICFWNNIKLEMRREVKRTNQKESVLISFPFSLDLNSGFIFSNSYSSTNTANTRKYQLTIIGFLVRIDFYPNTLGFCMEKLWILVWNVWNLCMELWLGVYVFFLYGKNQTINPFLMNFGLKEPYLVYSWCFGFRLVDCNSQVRNICIKEILGFLGRCCQNFSNFGWS